MSNATLPKTALEFFDARASSYEASTGSSTRQLARHLLSIIPPIDASSIILDNACRNGIVVQEILLLTQEGSQPLPKIYNVDGPPKMLEIGKQHIVSFPGSERAEWHEMPGEKLDFPDEHFNHSITNCGILFFNDAAQGAKEIHRTLKVGGTALVTSWAHLGYVDIVRDAQKAVAPDAELFRVPIPDYWFQASHLEKTLREAGFGDVDVHEKTVHYVGMSVEELARNLMRLLGLVDDVLLGELVKVIEEKSVRVEKNGNGSIANEVEVSVGIPMVALVAVSTK